MLEIINQENCDLLINVEIIPPKYNMIWGVDYLLMDSNNFMGSRSGEEYENIINIFNNIWNTREYHLLNKLK